LHKLVGTICFVALLSLSSFAATKTTVAQLDQLMADLYEQHKPDDSVATRLKEVELTEQLTPPAMNSLMQYKPGPYTIRQILLLSVETSLLPPPPADLPTLPAPDKDAQAALIRKALDYTSRDFTHLPKLTAEKQVLRFQNGVAYVKNTSGNGSQIGDNVQTPGEIAERLYPALIAQQTEPITIEAGVEPSHAVIKQRDPGGQFGQVSQGIAGLPLGAVLLDASRTSPAWLRWQTVNGRQTAVFAFTIPRKESHYKINYCCFPVLDHVGSGMGFASNSGSVTTFNPFAAAPGYHGELFIDTTTGVIVRLITKAEMKPTDFVQQEDIRVDYAPVLIGEQKFIVPAKSMILATVVPNGDSYVKFSIRRTLFEITYSKYELAAPAGH
jgi:hypothetical protein